MGSLDDQIQDTDVDLDQFETFVSYAKQLHDYVHYDLLTGRLSPERWTPDETGEENSANPFGDFDEAGRVKRSITHKRSEITARVRAIEKALDQLLSGMQRIAAEYKTVEELNRADMAKFQSLLAPSRDDPTAAPGDEAQGYDA